MPAARSRSTASRSRSPIRSPPSGAGIAIIYQELSLAPNLTVAENIYLGDEIHHRGLIDRKAMADGCRPVLERLGAPFTPETTVGTLSIAEQQLVEIARALHAKSKILVLDEPTTALSSRETERLFALIRQLRSRGHRADLHQPPHGRGLRAVRPGLGAARRHLCRHARPREPHRRRAGQDDGRPRPVELLHEGARPARQPRPGHPRGQGHHRRRPAGQALRASSCTRARCWASPGWSAPAAPSWRG